MKKFIKSFLLIIIIYLVIDIIFFTILPEKIKTQIYNKRAHKLISYYYHHDLRPNVSFYDNWGDVKYIIHTNNLGFKSKKVENAKFKKKNILFIGDSLVEGVGVKYKDTFFGKIENLYENKDIGFFNASLQSYSNAIYLSKIYHLVERKKLKFDEIFLVFTTNDTHDDFFRYGNVNQNFKLETNDDISLFLIYIFNFLKGNTFLYQFISEITPLKAGIQKIKNLISKINFKKNISNKETIKETTKKSISQSSIDSLISRKDYEFIYSQKKYDEWGDKAITKSINHLQRLSKFLKQKNIKLNIIYPTEASFLLKKPNTELFNKFIEKFRKFSKEENINFIILNKYHASYANKIEAYNDLFFIGDVHWNQKGHELVFNELKSKISFK